MTYVLPIRQQTYGMKVCRGSVQPKFNISMKYLLTNETQNFWRDTGMLPFPLAALWSISGHQKE